MTSEFILFFLIFTVLVGSIEIAKRKFAIQAGISRKVGHVAAALIASIMPFFLDKTEIILLGVVFAVLFLLVRRTRLLSSIHTVSRLTFGDVFLPLGVALSAAYFLPAKVAAFQFGILVMGVSDMLACFIGEWRGKHRVKIFGSAKSAEGSSAFFISTVMFVFLFVSRFSFEGVLVTLVLTGAEFVLVFGLDNLILPVLGAYLIQFLM